MCFVISAMWLGQFYRYFRAAICIKTLIDLMRCHIMRQKDMLDTLKKVLRHIDVCIRRECLLGRDANFSVAGAPFRYSLLHHTASV